MIYTITLFDSKGKQLKGSLEVEFNGNVGAGFKNHYLNYCRMFMDAKTHQIEITKTINNGKSNFCI